MAFSFIFLKHFAFLYSPLRCILPNIFYYFHAARSVDHTWGILLRCATARQEAKAGQGIARRKVMVSGKPDDDDGFAALAQLESA